MNKIPSRGINRLSLRRSPASVLITIGLSEKRRGMYSGKASVKAEVKRSEKVISKKLYHLRVKQGLTQEAVAAAVGLPYQSISRYEKGQTPITAGKLHRIAIYMNVPITAFFSDDYSEAIQIRLPGI